MVSIMNIDKNAEKGLSRMASGGRYWGEGR